MANMSHESMVPKNKSTTLNNSIVNENPKNMSVHFAEKDAPDERKTQGIPESALQLNDM